MTDTPIPERPERIVITDFADNVLDVIELPPAPEPDDDAQPEDTAA